jgi:hypothetical protein
LWFFHRCAFVQTDRCVCARSSVNGYASSIARVVDSLSRRSRQYGVLSRVSKCLLLVSIEETFDSSLVMQSGVVRRFRAVGALGGTCETIQRRDNAKRIGNAEKGQRNVRTFKLMLDESHRVVLFTSTHCLDARAEAGNGQNDDVANFLGGLHAGEILPGDVALACAHIEVFGIVEVCENSIGPYRRAGELDYALVVLGEGAGLLTVERFLGDVRDDIDEHGVARLGLDSPLAELDAARVPLSPVWTVRICLNSNDHAVGVGRHIAGDPIRRALQRGSVNVRVNSSSCEQD